MQVLSTVIDTKAGEVVAGRLEGGPSDTSGGEFVADRWVKISDVRSGEADVHYAHEVDAEPAGVTAAKAVETLQVKAEIDRLRAELDAWKKLTTKAWEAGAAWAASDPEWCRRKEAGF